MTTFVPTFTTTRLAAATRARAAPIVSPSTARDLNGRAPRNPRRPGHVQPPSPEEDPMDGLSRRTFVGLAAASGAALALPRSLAAGDGGKKKLLILGGTRFLGPALV